MLKRLTTKKNVSGDSTSKRDGNDTQSPHVRGKDDSNTENLTAQKTKSAKETVQGDKGSSTKKVTETTKSSKDPPATPSVDNKLRDALEKNKKMEETIRMIASQIIGVNFKSMDIGKLSSEMKQFLDRHLIRAQDRMEVDDVDSQLLSETFDEIDEQDRKYEELNLADDGAKVENEDDEYADDVPPKKKEFWTTLEQRIREGDTAHVKGLISSKELKMDEVNEHGQTLLMLAAMHGQYELVATAINLGADVDKIDTTHEKMTALKYSQEKGFLDIEELLQMNVLKTQLGRRIEEESGHIVRTNGATEGFYKTLDTIFSDKGKADMVDNVKAAASKFALSEKYLNNMALNMRDEVLEVILKVSVKSIEQRTAYSNDVLHIAYKFEVDKEKRRPTETVLFRAIEKTVKEILSEVSNKRDWFWLQSYLLSSPIWYEKQNQKDPKSAHLWDLLFEWVEAETKKQSGILSKPMRKIEESDAMQWNTLISYGKGSPEKCRQDEMENGLEAELTIDELIQSVSLSASFNPIAHHNLQQYLTKLVMIGHEYDDHFQHAIQEMFEVDPGTWENKKLKLLYMRGPVKRLDRCLAKCQSDYRDEQFPSAAHVLDIIRCSLTFDDVPTMLEGMDFFKQQIESGKFCVNRVMRIKNGFMEYKHDEATYTDIKFNVRVSVQGKEHDFIAEVQFLFRRMLEYKKIAHSLYSIERTREFMGNLTALLPIKRDWLKQLFIQSAKNNLTGFTDLMVTYGLNYEQLLKTNQRRQSVLTPICAKNSSRILNYLMNVVPKDSKMIRKMLVYVDGGESYPLRQAVEKNHFNGVLKHIMAKEDELNLATYAEAKRHIAHCWKSKSGESALLILKTMQSDEQRVRLIIRSITVEEVLQTGYAKLLEYIRETMQSERDRLQLILSHGTDGNGVKVKKSQVQRQMQFRQKWLAVGDSKHDGRWSNLHEACSSKAMIGGSVECVDALLSFYESDDGKEQLWKKNDLKLQTPLFNAVNEGNYRIVRWILEQMSDEDKVTFFTTSNTKAKYPIPSLLDQAATVEHLETLRTVLLSVSSLDITWSASVLGDIFLFCAKHNQVDTAKLLLDSISSDKERKATIAYKRREDRETALHLAAGDNHFRFVDFLLDVIDVDDKMLIEMLIDANSSGENALMRAADVSALRVTDRILEKVKNDNPEFLRKMLQERSNEGSSALQYAIKSRNHNSRKCAIKIIKYYDEGMDASSTFLSYLEIGDLEMVKKLWAQTQGDPKRGKKLLESPDAEGYNSFLIASKNGDYRSLKWLLSLNDDQRDEKEEDERNLMTKHKKTGQTPLGICVEHDLWKKLDGKRELTEEERESYFECVRVIFDVVTTPQNRDSLILGEDKYEYNSLCWSCWNGNIQTTQFLLDQLSPAKRKKQMRHSPGDHPYFLRALSGQNMDLIRLIHAEYLKATEGHRVITNLKEKEAALEKQDQAVRDAEAKNAGRVGTRRFEEAKEAQDVLKREVKTAKAAWFKKLEQELLRGSDALWWAFCYGLIGEVDWILNDLIGDPKKRMHSLNETIKHCKKGRQTEEEAQDVITKILERDLTESICDQRGIDGIRNIFKFLMEREKPPFNGISMILGKLDDSEETKNMWFKTVNCLHYAADGRTELMTILLKYLGDYSKPLLDQNVLIAAIEKHAVEVVRRLFERVKDSQTKDKMIETSDKKQNALIQCVKRSYSTLMKLVCDNHSNIEPILKDSFRSCLKSGNVKSVRFLLDTTKDKSVLLGERDEHGRTALMFAVQSGNAECLQLMIDELKEDLQRTRNETESVESEEIEEKKDEATESDADEHEMYGMTDKRGDNILHYLFSDPDRSASESQLHALKEVLGDDRLRDMLNQPNDCDELPLHRLNSSTVISILEWILELHDDPLDKFMVITSCWKRTRYGHSLYDLHSSESRIIREYFGEQLVECLETAEQLDMKLLRETFRFTLSWKRPKIQELILSKIEDENRPQLLRSDDLHCSNPIIFDLIRVDDPDVAKVVLPVIKEVSPQMLLSLSGERQSALEFSLSENRFNIMELIFDSMAGNERFLRQYIMCDWGGLVQIYQCRKMTKLVQDRLPDENIGEALFAAIWYDDEFEHTRSLMERCSTEEEKRKMLMGESKMGRTLFALAARFENRLAMEYVMEHVIQSEEDRVFCFTKTDYQFHPPLSLFEDHPLQIDLFQKALLSLSPKMRMQQLLWRSLYDETCGSLLTRSKDRTFRKTLVKLVMAELRKMEDPIPEIAASMLRCNGHQGHCGQIDILHQLFDLGMKLLDEDLLDLVLAKAPTEDLKYRCFVNYEGELKYNRIKDVVMASDRKKRKMLFDLMQRHILDSDRVLSILLDKDNGEAHPISALQISCDQGHKENFQAILNLYKGAKVSIEEQLFAVDNEGGTLLHRAMANVCEIPQRLFKEMKSDEMKMKMINQRRKSDGKCVLDIVHHDQHKKALKNEVMRIVRSPATGSKLEHSDFMPYFHWLVKENDLEKIRDLMDAFNEDVISSLSKNRRNAFHIACTKKRDDYGVIDYLLSKTKDEELKSVLMKEDNAQKIPLQYASKTRRLRVFEYIQRRDKRLLRDLILHSDAMMIMECASSENDLKAIFEFCDDDVVTRRLIERLSFNVEWGSEGNKIRDLIVETYNIRNASRSQVLSEDAMESKHDELVSGPFPEAEALAENQSVTPILNKVDVALREEDCWPIEDPETGDSSLALSLMADNRELFVAILQKLDDERKGTEYLSTYTNYRGSNLIHMALSRTTKRNEYMKILKEWLPRLSPTERDKLLYARDIDGDGIMHLVAKYAPEYSKEENHTLWNMVIDFLGKKDNEKRAMRLLFDYNEQGWSAMGKFLIQIEHFADGFGLFKGLVTNEKFGKVTKEDIPMFVKVLVLTLKYIKWPEEMMEIVQTTVKRFQRVNHAKRLLLFGDRGTGYKSMIDVIAEIDSVDSRRFLIQFVQEIIEENESSIKVDVGGRSPIHNLIGKDKEAALRLLERFEDSEIPRVLMTVDNKFEALISTGGSDVVSQFMRYLDVPQLLELFLETNEKRLFTHFQEICANSEDELTKLLLSEEPFDVRAHDGTTFSMKLLTGEVTEFNWITFHIGRLENDQRMDVLNQTDNMGNTALLRMDEETTDWKAVQKWQSILALFPNDDTKRDYLVRQNYLGVCAFDRASSRICDLKRMKSDELLFADSWEQGYRLQRAANRCITSRPWLIWTKRFLSQSTDFVDRTELLVPLFYVAALKYDLTLAKLVLSKINTERPKDVEKFLKATATHEQATVFHFAAKNECTGIMEILVDLSEKADLDLFKLLTAKSLDGTDDTPLINAVKLNRARIVEYLLSKVPAGKATHLILMKTDYGVPLDVNNYFKTDEQVISRDAVIWALEKYSQSDKHLRDLTVLKMLMEGCKDIKQVLKLFHYSNTLGESIYHYILTLEVCRYFESTLGVEFSKETWGKKDNAGSTPLMRAMTVYERDHRLLLEEDERKKKMEKESSRRTNASFMLKKYGSSDTTNNEDSEEDIEMGRGRENEEIEHDVRTNDDAVEFLEWVLKCCDNDAQRLWLIYQSADDGESVLDKISGAPRRFLIQQVLSILKRRKVEKQKVDLDSLMPIWLFALKEANTELAAKLLEMVPDDSYQLQLISGRHVNGGRTILAAALSGNIKILRFLDENFKDKLSRFIDESDMLGRTALHYAVKSGSREMVGEILKMYLDIVDAPGIASQQTSYSELIEGLRDDLGDTPFSYFLKENGSPEMCLYLLNRFDDKARKDQQMRDAATSATGRGRVTITDIHDAQPQSSVGSLARNIDEKMGMLFSRNPNTREIPLIEEYAAEMDMPMDIVSDFVYEYMVNLHEVDMSTYEMVGYCLLFEVQREESMARIQMIIEKVKGSDMLDDVLQVRNQSNHDALYRLAATEKLREFAWFLDEVPNDHECLWTRSLHRGDTAFMRLLDAGQKTLAKKLLDKITNKEKRLMLITMRREKRIEGGGTALEIAIRKNIKPVIDWLTEEKENLQN